jgi:hypothetical protein
MSGRLWLAPLSQKHNLRRQAGAPRGAGALRRKSLVAEAAVDHLIFQQMQKCFSLGYLSRLQDVQAQQYDVVVATGPGRSPRRLHRRLVLATSATVAQ